MLQLFFHTEVLQQSRHGSVQTQRHKMAPQWYFVQKVDEAGKTSTHMQTQQSYTKLKRYFFHFFNRFALFHFSFSEVLSNAVLQMLHSRRQGFLT